MPWVNKIRKENIHESNRDRTGYSYRYKSPMTWWLVKYLHKRKTVVEGAYHCKYRGDQNREQAERYRTLNDSTMQTVSSWLERDVLTIERVSDEVKASVDFEALSETTPKWRMVVVNACIDTVQNHWKSFLRISDRSINRKGLFVYIPMLTPFPILPSAWTLFTPYEYHDRSK